MQKLIYQFLPHILLFLTTIPRYLLLSLLRHTLTFLLLIHPTFITIPNCSIFSVPIILCTSLQSTTVSIITLIPQISLGTIPFRTHHMCMNLSAFCLSPISTLAYSSQSVLVIIHHILSVLWPLVSKMGSITSSLSNSSPLYILIYILLYFFFFLPALLLSLSTFYHTILFLWGFITFLFSLFLTHPPISVPFSICNLIILYSSLFTSSNLLCWVQTSITICIPASFKVACPNNYHIIKKEQGIHLLNRFSFICHPFTQNAVYYTYD